jgi:DNA-binding Xre family transcriptional regulator
MKGMRNRSIFIPSTGMLVDLRVRELLDERKMTRTELADKTGLSLERVGRLANNQWSQLTRDELALIRWALGATIEELFSVHQASLFFGPLRSEHVRSSSLVSA